MSLAGSTAKYYGCIGTRRISHYVLASGPEFASDLPIRKSILVYLALTIT